MNFIKLLLIISLPLIFIINVITENSPTSSENIKPVYSPVKICTFSNGDSFTLEFTSNYLLIDGKHKAFFKSSYVVHKQYPDEVARIYKSKGYSYDIWSEAPSTVSVTRNGQKGYRNAKCKLQLLK